MRKRIGNYFCANSEEIVVLARAFDKHCNGFEDCSQELRRREVVMTFLDGTELEYHTKK